jgi:putative heme-binding domain-containing protein
VQTKGGESISGFLVKQSAGQVVIKTADLKQITIPATSVQKMTAEKLSAMPEGILADLDAQEAADLLAYLGTLK